MNERSSRRPAHGRSDQGLGVTIRVVVTDRDKHVRDHLTTIINSHPDLDVVATAATLAEARAVVARHHPEVAVVDPRLQDHGADFCAELRVISPETRCIVHAAGTHDGQTPSSSGAVSEVVYKQLRGDQLIASIRHLAAGRSTTDPCGDAGSASADRAPEVR